MKIVHVVEPLDTGINTFIHELVFGMPECEHIIVHGVREDSRKIEEIKAEYENRVKFIRWKNVQREIKLIADTKAYFELSAVLKSLDFDVLHLHSSKASVIGRVVAFFKGYKNVIYTPNAVSFLRTDISKSKIGLYKRIERFAALRLPGKIVSSSKSEYEAYLSIDVKTKIIQNGVEIPVSLNESPSTKDRHFRVATCGKITIQKDPYFFNRIASFFVGRPIEFQWIGEGEMRHALTSENIEITGWCSKEQVFEHLHDVDLYLSTSSWEGLSLAAIEAMAFGKPLLLSKCNGNIDLVINDINGYLFDSKEKAIERIEYLMSNADKLKELSDNSLNMYQRHYKNHRCAREYFNLYKALTKLSKA